MSKSTIWIVQHKKTKKIIGASIKKTDAEVKAWDNSNIYSRLADSDNPCGYSSRSSRKIYITRKIKL